MDRIVYVERRDWGSLEQRVAFFFERKKTEKSKTDLLSTFGDVD